MFPFSNYILKTRDMTKDNTKFVIIQEDISSASNQTKPKIPIIYEWLSINTPSKSLYDLVNSSLYLNGYDERNMIEYQLMNTLDNKLIENDDKEIRTIKGSHIIEIKIVIKPKYFFFGT